MEESAFEQIAVRLRRKAMDTSRTCGMSTAASEDIAQDVMLKLWSMRDKLDKYPSIDGLTILMAKRLTLNKLRDEKIKDIGNKQYHISTSSASPHEALEDKENTEWLDRKMEALPTTQHTILYMRQVERRSNREIAKLLGISETSVSTLLARARRALMEELKARR